MILNDPKKMNSMALHSINLIAASQNTNLPEDSVIAENPIDSGCQPSVRQLHKPAKTAQFDYLMGKNA